MWRIFLFRMGMLAAICVARVHASAEDFLAKPDPEWDRVFQRSEGWTGGDAMYSLPLDDRRVLWLFADTWIGPVENNKHVPGSKLVNNTLAMHSLLPAGKTPAPDEVSFRWGNMNDAEKPQAWIRPPTENDAPDAPEHWYWVADAVMLPGPNGKERLCIFLWHIERAEGEGVFNFRSRGGALAIVDNPQDDWEQWNVRQVVNPHATRAGAKPETTWGCEAMLVTEAGGEQFVYVYGTQTGAQMVLARAVPEKIDDFAAWEFRTPTGWSYSIARAAAVARGVTSEFSITPIEREGKSYWVLIQSELFLGPHVLARVATSPAGPWSRPKKIYRVLDLERNKNYFTYAAKAHPELSRPGELLITYVVNSADFGAMVNDAWIYRPRFLRLPLDGLDWPK